jgi:hypothetical protein
MFQKPNLIYKPLKVKKKKTGLEKKKAHPSKDQKRRQKSNLRPRFLG